MSEDEGGLPGSYNVRARGGEPAILINCLGSRARSFGPRCYQPIGLCALARIVT